MAYADRLEIMQRLQEIRGTKIVTHINSSRRAIGPPPPGLITKLATEAQPFFYKALRTLGRYEAIDLFLCTQGGQTDSVWPLVSLFREFSEKFNVLVPFMAHSAGTLVCLGADTIVMGEAGELSPVDPSVGSSFSPVDEINQGVRKAISVEDVISFFTLASDPTKTQEDQDTNNSAVDINLAFRLLAEQVHPLALGNVNRSHTQIRQLGERLLQLHTDGDDKDIEGIVLRLTQERYSHTDVLNRREAIDLLGENMVITAEGEEHDLMWSLYEDYNRTMSLDKTLILTSELGEKQTDDLRFIGSFIETDNISLVFRADCTVTKRSVLPQGFQLTLQPGTLPPIIPGFPLEINLELKEMGWIENEEGKK
jgi:hypothetical protein